MAAGERATDRIYIRDLVMRCIIGIEPHEREHTQDVSINIAMHVDLRRPGQSDQIEDTVNYKTIKNQIVTMVQTSQFFLVECLAQKIADICLGDPRVQQVEVTLDKPGALRYARSVAVHIVRQQQDRPG